MAEKGGPQLPTSYPTSVLRRTRPTKGRRVLQGFAVLLGAATLATLLPVNLLRIQPLPISAPKPPALLEWKDDVWPIREQTPWDISTDYAHPRLLEYDVQEGTWLRLDVNRASGELIFDMVGDIYCISSADASLALNGVPATARPVLLGVPHDSDPHFSPSGDRIVFRSDAGLGVENIFVKPWAGCEAADLRNPNGASSLVNALANKVEDEEILAKGIRETDTRKARRLIREGRHDALRVTNETFRWVSDARFDAAGKHVLATKWITSSRSLGAGEAWEYEVPSLNAFAQKPIAAGSGKRVLGRSVPRGWTHEQTGEAQQIGPEQSIPFGADSVIFSKNVMDEFQFQYSKDVHTGIYAIFLHNSTTQHTTELVSAHPGGASRPELSPDQRTLAFVRRDRDHEILVLKDLQTGTIHHVWDGLTFDLTTISAPMGTYPSFAFTPSADAVIIWAAGQIYSVPITTNSLGERIADPSRTPSPIRFDAHIEKRLAETVEGEFDLVGFETAETQRVTAFKDLGVDAAGKRAVFHAAGVTYIQDLKTQKAARVAVLDASAPYYSPAWVPGDDYIIHARWSNSNFSSFEVADVHGDKAFEVAGLPLGRYIAPTVSDNHGSHRTIAFFKTGGDSILTGNIVATAGEGLYLADLTLPTHGKSFVENVRFVPSEISAWDRFSLRFIHKDKALLVQQSDRAFVIELSEGPSDVEGLYPHIDVATGEMSAELAVSSPHKSKKGYAAGSVAFVESYNVYFVDGENVKGPVWSKPNHAPASIARLSLDGGHEITWSQDGKTLFWLLGPYLHSLEVSKLHECKSEIKKDKTNFGIQCVKTLLDVQEITVNTSTDIARLKKESAALNTAAQPTNSDVFVIYNATILTMETGELEKDLIREGVVVVRGGVIESAGPAGSFSEAGFSAYNAQGGFVIPGFVDVHAHWIGFESLYPAASWELRAFLAYGVTTLHNPSSATVNGFDERYRVESGQIVGPRIFSTGEVIYGAAAPGLHQDIVDEDEAYSALLRLRVEGGMGSISYKNYNLPIRASRQRLLNAARTIKMRCFPEGGMNWDWDLTYIIDGMTTVEHAIPVPVLYDDVLTLFAASGTGYTPTHIVNYGGVMGEQRLWATEDLPNDPKLREFLPHENLNYVVESTARPATSYQFFNTSISAAKMIHKGLKVNVGAHGENPLGVMYHKEMEFTKAGGLTNYETIQAATSAGAQSLGLFGSIGSLSPGKLADLLVYPAGVDLLEGDIANTRELLMVARGGRFWETATLEEVWPVKGRKQGIPPINAD
uniref:Amidohydrolase-related domain-containing protein n=1 Tax=Mycena chlorophos TaxID=658473 RepID=A0ABQ0L867_MYCCL|nr:predicted protein [Mycena chlorophos]